MREGGEGVATADMFEPNMQRKYLLLPCNKFQFDSSR